MRSPSSILLVGRLSASVFAIAAGSTIALSAAAALPRAEAPAAADLAEADNTTDTEVTDKGADSDETNAGLMGASPDGRAEGPSAGPLAPLCRAAWTAPVDAPITDSFRPPDHRYGPGNRGIEYGTEPGQDVLAVADGVVEFAGPVAGRPVIVIDHGAGLRSSYVHLLEGSVGRGLVVGRGQRIAAADTAFHLGARRERRYVDPADLIERRCLVVRLVAT